MRKYLYIACLAFISLNIYGQVNSVAGKLLVDDPEVNLANVKVTITFRYLKKRIHVTTDQEGMFLLNNLPDYDDFYISVPSIDSKTMRYKSKVYVTTRLRDVVLGIKLILTTEDKKISRMARARQDIEFRNIKGARVEDHPLHPSNMTISNWNWITRDFAFHRQYAKGVSAYGTDIADSRVTMANNMLLNRWAQDVRFGNMSLDGSLPLPFGILASTSYSANWNAQVANTHLYELNMRPIKQFLGVSAFSSTGLTPQARKIKDGRIWREKSIGLQKTAGFAVDIPIISQLLMRISGEYDLKSHSKTPNNFTTYQRNAINQSFISLDPVAQNAFLDKAEKQENLIKAMFEAEFYFNAQNNIGLSALANYQKIENVGVSDFVLKSNKSLYEQTNTTLYTKLYVNNLFSNMVSNRIDVDFALRRTNSKPQNTISALRFEVGNLPLLYGSDQNSFMDNEETSIDVSDQIQINLANQVINATIRYTYYSRLWTGLQNPFGVHYFRDLNFIKGGKPAVASLDFTVGDRRVEQANVNKIELRMSEFFLSLKDEFFVYKDILAKVGANIYAPTNGTTPVRNEGFEQAKKYLKHRASEYNSNEVTIGGFNINPYWQMDWKPKRFATTISGRLFFNSQPLSKSWISSIQAQSFLKTANRTTVVNQFGPALFNQPVNYTPLEYNNIGNWVMSHPKLKTKSTFGASLEIGYRPIRDLQVQVRGYNNISLNSYALENLNAEYFHHKVNAETPLLTYERYREDIKDIYGLYTLDKGESSYGIVGEAVYANEVVEARMAYEYAKSKNYTDIISNHLPQQFSHSVISRFNNLDNSAFDPGTKFSLSFQSRVFENRLLKLNAGINYWAQQGQRFSYGYEISPEFYLQEPIHPVSLLYIPKKVEDVSFVPFTNRFGEVVSIDNQRQLFSEFMRQHGGFSNGGVSRRNGYRMPMNQSLDLNVNMYFYILGNRGHFVNMGLTAQNTLAAISENLSPVYFSQNHVVPVLTYEGTVFAQGKSRQTFTYRHLTAEPEKVINNNPNLFNDFFRLWLTVSYNF